MWISLGSGGRVLNSSLQVKAAYECCIWLRDTHFHLEIMFQIAS